MERRRRPDLSVERAGLRERPDQCLVALKGPPLPVLPQEGGP